MDDKIKNSECANSNPPWSVYLWSRHLSRINRMCTNVKLLCFVQYCYRSQCGGCIPLPNKQIWIIPNKLMHCTFLARTPNVISKSVFFSFARRKPSDQIRDMVLRLQCSTGFYNMRYYIVLSSYPRSFSPASKHDCPFIFILLKFLSQNHMAESRTANFAPLSQPTTSAWLHNRRRNSIHRSPCFLFHRLPYLIFFISSKHIDIVPFHECRAQTEQRSGQKKSRKEARMINNREYCAYTTHNIYISNAEEALSLFMYNRRWLCNVRESAENWAATFAGLFESGRFRSNEDIAHALSGPISEVLRFLDIQMRCSQHRSCSGECWFCAKPCFHISGL